MTDADIIHLVLAGDTEAFGQMVERYGKLVYAMCLERLHDRHEAQDATQDTFIRAYRNLRSLRAPEAIVGWLRRTAACVCSDRRNALARSASLPVEPSDPAPDPVRYLEIQELVRTVLRHVSELPETYRRPVELHYLQGVSLQEIAKTLGLTPGCVRTRLHRAHHLLKSNLLTPSLVDTYSRSKGIRLWLPSNLSGKEHDMSLGYEKTGRKLSRGDVEVSIRAMTKEDIPAMRKYDRELTAALEDRNAKVPPGKEGSSGGPWSDDQWLLEHFNKYAERGNLTLLVRDKSGKIVGFADLWVGDEPEPFGRSLNVQCIDYFHDYYLLGLETVLLEEAENVARAAGLPSLDIGTNTCSGDYPVLRRFGMRVFYEYDSVLCRCPDRSAKPAFKITQINSKTAPIQGLVRVGHYAPSDFSFRSEQEQTLLFELSRGSTRAILELWRFNPSRMDADPVPPNAPNKSELYVDSTSLFSAAAMSEILRECAVLAARAGATEIPIAYPSDMELDPKNVDVIKRNYAFAWLRKHVISTERD